MMRYNAKACSACQACSVACIDENDLPGGHGRICSYRFVTESEIKTETGYKFVRKMHGCMHCDNAPCMAACPMGCFTRDEDTGLVLPNNAACIGCGQCAKVCPFDAIRFRADGKMTKCDGCIDRVRSGMQSACENICPPRALSYRKKAEK